MKRPDEIVVGLGEVGSALKEEVLDCDGYDWQSGNLPSDKSYRVVHIAFPYSPQTFLGQCIRYATQFEPEHLVIHSTVPVGMCAKVQHAVKPKVTHSPVRGLHPHLAESLRKFVKFYGGPWAMEIAASYPEEIPRYRPVPKWEDTEALKLWSTTAYGLLILLEKAIWDYCQRNHLDFDIVYTAATSTYNDGYAELNLRQYIRPVLRHIPGPIGGNCVIPNAKMLDDDIARLVVAWNHKLQER